MPVPLPWLSLDHRLSHIRIDYDYEAHCNIIAGASDTEATNAEANCLKMMSHELSHKELLPEFSNFHQTILMGESATQNPEA